MSDLVNQIKEFYDKEYWKYALKFNIPLLPHYLSRTTFAKPFISGAALSF